VFNTEKVRAESTSLPILTEGTRNVQANRPPEMCRETAVCHKGNKQLELKRRKQEEEGQYYIKRNFTNISVHKPAVWQEQIAFDFYLQVDEGVRLNIII
jgi:hypothetical protein